MERNTFIIAKEGWKLLAGLAIAWVLFALLDADFLQFVTLVAFAGTLYLYRNPERAQPYLHASSIVAMMDGTVSAIESVEGYDALEGPCYKITIASGLTDIGVLRVPFDGTVASYSMRTGSRLQLSAPQARQLNSMATLHFSDAENHTLVVTHTVGFSIDTVHVRTVAQQQLLQGSRYGFMVGGEHVIYLPGKSRVSIKVGEKVRAGETLIGYFS